MPVRDIKLMKRRQLLDPTEVDETVLELARERITVAFDRFDHIAVMFSGGKDSTCVLHMAIDEHKRRGLTEPLDVVFWDEEAIPYETVDYIRTVAAWPMVSLRWLCLPIRQVNGCSPSYPHWFAWAPEEHDLWCRPLPPEAIITNQMQQLEPEHKHEIFGAWDFDPVDNRISIAESNSLLFSLKTHGTVGLLMGIRADESMTRRRAVLRRMEDNWIVPFTRITYQTCQFPGCTEPTTKPTTKTCEEHKGRRMPGIDPSDIHNIFKLYPIYDWHTEDVWTFARDLAHDPVTGEPVYNTTYDLLEMAGIPHFRQRCTSPYGNEPMGSLWTFKVCHPELWDKMCERVPGASTAARYAKTQLYAFGARPVVSDAEWWDDEAWRKLIRELLMRHDEKTRKPTADRIRVIIERHNAKTISPRSGAPDPLLPDIPHPVTGVSWQFLAMVAQRGDPKQRKNPEWQIIQRDDPTALPKIRKRYEDGLKIWRAEHARNEGDLA